MCFIIQERISLWNQLIEVNLIRNKGPLWEISVFSRSPRNLEIMMAEISHLSVSRKPQICSHIHQIIELLNEHRQLECFRRVCPGRVCLHFLEFHCWLYNVHKQTQQFHFPRLITISSPKAIIHAIPIRSPIEMSSLHTFIIEFSSVPLQRIPQFSSSCESTSAKEIAALHFEAF